MKTIFRKLSLILSLVLASAVWAAPSMPQVNVTILDSAGKVAYKGRTNSSGTFATNDLPAGHYVVQFNGEKSMKGGPYLLVISAGNKKVSAEGVEASKFSGGGVAMKLDVANKGAKVSGQIATNAKNVKAGRVWIPPQLGSNMPGHWAEADSAEAVAARAAGRLSNQDVENMRSKSTNSAGGF